MAVIRSFDSSFSKNLANNPKATNKLVFLTDENVVCDEEPHDLDEKLATVPAEEVARYSLSSIDSRDAPLEPEFSNDPTWSSLEPGEYHQTLGQLMSETRARRGMSREQVADRTHIPAYYVKMIESDSYDAIPDQLYLLPFFRRYAVFLGLDEQQVVSRFIHDFEKAESELGETSAPPAEARKALWKRLALTAAVGGIAFSSLALGVGIVRTAFRRPAETVSAVAIVPKALASPVVVVSDAPVVSVAPPLPPPSAAVVAPPIVTTASEKPPIVLPHAATKHSARKRNHSYLHFHRHAHTRG